MHTELYWKWAKIYTLRTWSARSVVRSFDLRFLHLFFFLFLFLFFFPSKKSYEARYRSRWMAYSRECWTQWTIAFCNSLCSRNLRQSLLVNERLSNRRIEYSYASHKRCTRRLKGQYNLVYSTRSLCRHESNISPYQGRIISHVLSNFQPTYRMATWRRIAMNTAMFCSLENDRIDVRS